MRSALPRKLRTSYCTAVGVRSFFVSSGGRIQKNRCDRSEFPALLRKNNTVSPGEPQTRISCPPRYCSDERGVGVERPLMRFLVLVLVLGVSASSLDLRFATSIPSRKISPTAIELRSNAMQQPRTPVRGTHPSQASELRSNGMRAANERSQQFGSTLQARAFGQPTS